MAANVEHTCRQLTRACAVTLSDSHEWPPSTLPMVVPLSKHGDQQGFYISSEDAPRNVFTTKMMGTAETGVTGMRQTTNFRNGKRVNAKNGTRGGRW